MRPKFSSKEIHFLKTDSDDLTITPPQTYFCDLVVSGTDRIERFEKRLKETKIPGEHFLCAAIQISPKICDTALEKANTTFEQTFNLLLDHGRGIWESLDERSFILAFWDYNDKNKASSLMVSLKEKLSAALDTDILIGVAHYPFHDFAKDRIPKNALKAIDHAAFFGPDTLIHFDAVSLNISGDRFYHLNQFALAQEDYTKGLEIKPDDINLINSLGVCRAVLGDLDQAKKEFECAAKINSNEAMVIYNIGLLHRINDEIDTAIAYLRKAHGIDDSIFEIELLLGHLLHTKKQPQQALPHLEAAIRLNPDSGDAHRMKGEILLAQDKPDKAAGEFNRAIKLNPMDAVSLSGYAQCLELQEKNLPIALSFAKNSLAMEPDNPLFKQRLDMIQEKLAAEEESCQTKIA